MWVALYVAAIVAVNWMFTAIAPWSTPLGDLYLANVVVGFIFVLRDYAQRLRMDPAVWQVVTLAQPSDRRRLLAGAAALATKLEAERDKAWLSRELATIRCDVALDVTYTSGTATVDFRPLLG